MRALMHLVWTWKDPLRRRALNQIRVMEEFGYPTSVIVKAILERGCPFPDAGTLMIHLEESENREDGEIAPSVTKADEKTTENPQAEATHPDPIKPAEKTTVNPPETITREERRRKIESETYRLYMHSVCSICRERKKTFVLLPCSHLELCNHCVNKTFNCPQCKDPIHDKIKIYETCFSNLFRIRLFFYQYFFWLHI